VLRILAVAREPVTIAQLIAKLAPRAGHGDVLDAVEALRRRSVVERAKAPGAAFTLQSVVLEYVTDRLVEEVADEIARGQTVQLVALLDAWRGRPPGEQGYGPGNVVNLLRLLRGDLRGLDLGHLALRQAYLAGLRCRTRAWRALTLLKRCWPRPSISPSA
jgi:hypothetical protein